MKGLVLAVMMLGSFAIARAVDNEFSGTVINVIDGNTIEVQGADDTMYRVVLAGIDCPEPGQKYFDQAKERLAKLVLKREVIVRIQGRNRWGHHVAVVLIARNGKDPRMELLEDGLAWTAEKDPLPDLEALRLQAAEKKKGIWEEEVPTPPWKYRREQSMMQPKSS